jgi:pilus assembly protein CpaB
MDPLLLTSKERTSRIPTMKASTLFVIVIALLIGLGVAAGAKYFGLFKAREDAPVAKEEGILVLVANKDLHPGIAITSADVRVRELVPAVEKGFYDQNRNRVFPPLVSAAQLKVPTQKIQADTILLRTQFKEDLPEAVTIRLQEGMRSVNVSVPKDRCAGGVIQMGEFVDVLLTSRISNDPKNVNAETKTALLARDCRVVMKRNRMVNVLAADPEGVPISFTLEVNPYRAALIEYAQHKGLITLLPVRHDDATILQATSNRSTMMPKSMSDMKSKEFRNEDTWVEEIKNGDRVISETDLKRIFAIDPPRQPIPPIRVTTIVGITPQRENLFPGDGSRGQPATGGSGGQTNISNPADPKDKECVDCPKPKTDGLGGTTITPPNIGVKK